MYGEIPISVAPTKPPVFLICHLLYKGYSYADSEIATRKIQSKAQNLYLELKLVNASDRGLFIYYVQKDLL